jgi:hypothetical protein
MNQFVIDNWQAIEHKMLSIPMENKFKIEFIRTNNKENIINFIVSNVAKNKNLIRERFYTKGESNG